MFRLALSTVVLTAASAGAHDVSVEVFGSATAPSESNPRSGGAGAAGSYDFNDSWSAWAGFGYTRDLATQTAGSSSSGSNIFSSPRGRCSSLQIISW